MYYQDQEEWKERMFLARKMVIDKFSTTRMLEEYVDKLYRLRMKVRCDIKLCGPD